MPNLYVTEQGAQLEKEAGQVLVCKGGEVLAAVPAARIAHVVLVGMVGVTTPALTFLLERGIDLVLLDAGGAFRGRLTGDLSPHIDLRHRQHQRADDVAFRLALGRAIVAGKLANQRALLLRWDDGNDDPALLDAAADLLRLAKATTEAEDVDALMGIEGQAAKTYFACFRQQLDPAWSFVRRARRPPPDPVNALLSTCYTLLHEQCRSALIAAGLDASCGFLHAPRRGRASLAVDLMEEFRAVIADSVVLTLINKRRLAPADFTDGATGPRLSKTGWRALADQYETRLQTRITPPGLKQATTYQKLIDRQAHKLRHLIEGSIETYEPFKTR